MHKLRHGQEKQLFLVVDKPINQSELLQVYAKRLFVEI